MLQPNNIIKSVRKATNTCRSIIEVYDTYVIKKYVNRDNKKKQFLVTNEVLKYLTVKSKHIIRLIEYSVFNEYIMLERGTCDLDDAIVNGDISKEAAIQQLEIIRDDFESEQITHNDLKFSNIMYCAQHKWLKVIDLECMTFNYEPNNGYFKRKINIVEFNTLIAKINRRY